MKKKGTGGREKEKLKKDKRGGLGGASSVEGEVKKKKDRNRCSQGEKKKKRKKSKRTCKLFKDTDGQDQNQCEVVTKKRGLFRKKLGG